MAVDFATLAATTTALTAVVGVAVAALAYRGGQRNDSDAMRFLAVGITCIAVLPFPLAYGVVPLFALTDAQSILALALANVVGLLAILYSLDAT